LVKNLASAKKEKSLGLISSGIKVTLKQPKVGSPGDREKLLFSKLKSRGEFFDHLVEAISVCESRLQKSPDDLISEPTADLPVPAYSDYEMQSVAGKGAGDERRIPLHDTRKGRDLELSDYDLSPKSYNNFESISENSVEIKKKGGAIDYSSGHESSDEQPPEPPRIVRIPEDEELMQLLEEEHPMLEGFKHSSTKVLRCGVEKMFELLFSDDAPLPFDQYQRDLVPTKNQKVTPWIMGNATLPPDAKIEKAYQFDRSAILQSRQCEADVL